MLAPHPLAAPSGIRLGYWKGGLCFILGASALTMVGF